MLFTSGKNLPTFVNVNVELANLVQSITAKKRESALYTLIGLKLLEQNFSVDKPKWKLIGAKARKVLKTEFNMDVDAALELLKVELAYF
jgi:hypothetical protein